MVNHLLLFDFSIRKNVVAEKLLGGRAALPCRHFGLGKAAALPYRKIGES